MIYMVTYCPRPERELPTLEKELKKFGNWAHYTPMAWFIATTDDANTVYERLAAHLTMNDFLFVAAMDPSQYKGWMPQEFWTWVVEVRNRGY